MENTRISVVIPTYNGEKFIGRAIKSVLNQTFQNFEVIVVDDVSRDDTVEIVKTLQKEDSRVNLIELKENTGGPAIPRTIACKKTRAEYIAFLDQDDLYYPEYLELKIKYLEKHPEVDVVSSLAWAFDDETKKIINYEHGGPVNNFMRKKAVEDGGYFRPEQNGVDEIGNLNRYILKNGLDGVKLLSPGPVTLYSRHLSQGSYVENKNPGEFVSRIESLISDFPEEKIQNLNKGPQSYFINSHGVWDAHLGNFYCLGGNPKKGRKYFGKSLEIKFNIFAFGLLILSLFGFTFYRRTEFCLRIFQRGILWRFKVLVRKLTYRKSYKEALMILSRYQ